MGYGQLIWDVPKIKGLDKPDECNQKAKVVKEFLDSLNIRYEKKFARVDLGERKEVYIYGYSVKNEEAPFFNNSDVLSDASKKVFFIVRRKKTENIGTRVVGQYQYFLYKRKSPIVSDKTKIAWSQISANVELIGRKKTENLFD